MLLFLIRKSESLIQILFGLENLPGSTCLHLQNRKLHGVLVIIHQCCVQRKQAWEQGEGANPNQKQISSSGFFLNVSPIMVISGENLLQLCGIRMSIQLTASITYKT